MKECVEEVVSERSDLRKEVERLNKEIDRLYKQLAEGRRFKQFVEIKREVNQLRERNICLAKYLPHETLPVIRVNLYFVIKLVLFLMSTSIVQICNFYIKLNVSPMLQRSLFLSDLF